MIDFFSNISLIDQILLAIPLTLVFLLYTFMILLVIYRNKSNKNRFISNVNIRYFYKLLHVALLGTMTIFLGVFLLNFEVLLSPIIGTFFCVIGYQIVLWSVGIRSEFLANDV